MTDKQWRFWESRNLKALISRYGPKLGRKKFEKLKKKAMKNEAMVESCKLHDFDWKAAIKKEEERRKRWGVELGRLIVTNPGYCRCKNCGGKLPIMYAAPYMEAVEHMKRLEEQNSGRADEIGVRSCGQGA